MMTAQSSYFSPGGWCRCWHLKHMTRSREVPWVCRCCAGNCKHFGLFVPNPFPCCDFSIFPCSESLQTQGAGQVQPCFVPRRWGLPSGSPLLQQVTFGGAAQWVQVPPRAQVPSCAQLPSQMSWPWQEGEECHGLVAIPDHPQPC